jgi:hypothetical protein
VINKDLPPIKERTDYMVYRAYKHEGIQQPNPKDQDEISYSNRRYDYRHSYMSKWALFKPASKYENLFNELNKKNSKVNIVDADPAIKMFNLPDWVDEKIWRMADIDRDGMLDRLAPNALTRP